MKLGLHIAATDWPQGSLGPQLADIVRAAEDAGFDTISVTDHLWQHPIMGGPVANQVEAYTTLGYIAALTGRARLLALATAAPYRPAGLLAKMVTTLDVLAGGRAMLGIGVGDYPEEAAGLGVPYPSLDERYTLLDETVRVCLKMWAGEHGDDEPFHGERVRIDRALNVPQALSNPHPPVMITGGGERRTPAARRSLCGRLQHPSIAGVPAQAGRAQTPVRRGGTR